MIYRCLSLWGWNWFQGSTCYCSALCSLYLASHLGILVPFSFKTDKEGILAHERIIRFISFLKDMFLPVPETQSFCIYLLLYLQASRESRRGLLIGSWKICSPSFPVSMIALSSSKHAAMVVSASPLGWLSEGVCFILCPWKCPLTWMPVGLKGGKARFMICTAVAEPRLL